MAAILWLCAPNFSQFHHTASFHMCAIVCIGNPVELSTRCVIKKATSGAFSWVVAPVCCSCLIQLASKSRIIFLLDISSKSLLGRKERGHMEASFLKLERIFYFDFFRAERSHGGKPLKLERIWIFEKQGFLFIKYFMVHVFLHQNANKFTNFPLSTLAIFFQSTWNTHLW